MTNTEQNISRAIKVYNSCFNKFINILPWSQPIPDRISYSIDLLKHCVLDLKIKKDLQNQIKYSFLIDEYYDELYKYTLDRTDKSLQSTNLKDLILLCDKDNKQNFINNNEIKHDILKLIKKYIKISEEIGDDYKSESCYKFILEYYNTPNDTQIDFILEIYDKLKNLKGEYNEKYIELIVCHKQDFIHGAELYEELALKKLNTIQKFSIDLLLLKSFLCYLNFDEIKAKNKIIEFEQTFSIISNKRNYKFCIDILECYSQKDINKFTDIVRDYNNIVFLDDYLVMLLNNIKKNIIKEDLDLC